MFFQRSLFVLWRRNDLLQEPSSNDLAAKLSLATGAGWTLHFLTDYERLGVYISEMAEDDSLLVVDFHTFPDGIKNLEEVLSLRRHRKMPILLVTWVEIPEVEALSTQGVAVMLRRSGGGSEGRTVLDVQNDIFSAALKLASP